jgi:hypothetical protein
MSVRYGSCQRPRHQGQHHEPLKVISREAQRTDAWENGLITQPFLLFPRKKPWRLPAVWVFSLVFRVPMEVHSITLSHWSIII